MSVDVGIAPETVAAQVGPEVGSTTLPARPGDAAAVRRAVGGVSRDDV
jgi:hypothetical protein